MINKKKIFAFFFIVFTIFAGQPLATDDSFSLGKGEAKLEFLSEYFEDNTEKELALPLSFSPGLLESTYIVFTAYLH